MKLFLSLYLSLIGSSSSFELTEPSDGADVFPLSVSQQSEIDASASIRHLQSRLFDRRSKAGKAYKPKTGKAKKQCDPATINLADYDQWIAEKGYWIGEYTFLQGDGTPNASPSWPYPYDAYKGFITGNVKGNAYRQRNVFFYPPQKQEVCDAYTEDDVTVVGSGTCGVNGNTKLFAADQKATSCDGGNLEGLYAGLYPTTTQLIGDNALLYQVYFENVMIQSQLTTITEDASGQTFRTRSAQGFDPVTQISNSCSYYRERKVEEEEFWEEFNRTITVYNVQVEDLCKADPTSEEVGSTEKCVTHLKSSFLL